MPLASFSQVMGPMRLELSAMKTLPDYLADDLEIVFVGLNPGLSSVEAGHYFANKRNRFWTALNASGLLSTPADSSTDHLLLNEGIGFTDVVKRPTRGSSDLRAADFRKWAPLLREKLERYQPLVACFHGVTAFRNFLKYSEGGGEVITLGPQKLTIGSTAMFVVPNPSPANAAYSYDDIVGWHRELKAFLVELRKAGPA